MTLQESCHHSVTRWQYSLNGSSTPFLIQQWHFRSWSHPGPALEPSLSQLSSGVQGVVHKLFMHLHKPGINVRTHLGIQALLNSEHLGRILSPTFGGSWSSVQCFPTKVFLSTIKQTSQSLTKPCLPITIQPLLQAGSETGCQEVNRDIGKTIIILTRDETIQCLGGFSCASPALTDGLVSLDLPLTLCSWACQRSLCLAQISAETSLSVEFALTSALSGNSRFHGVLSA